MLGPGRNIELKARIGSLEAARRIAEPLATRHVGVEHQVDTYFHVSSGRLKLREIDQRDAQLISYARGDLAEPKPSDYQIVPTAHPAELKAALTAALGIDVIVEKRREIFLRGAVRVHLDEVSRLGNFLEFEAVLGDDFDENAGHAEIARLRKSFAIEDSQLLEVSYCDMLRAPCR